MKDYAEKQNLNIIYDWKVTRIKREDCKHKNDKHKSVFILQNTRGDEIRCHVLLMATGAVSEKLPDIEGVELAETYGSHSINQEEYENKFVCIIGGGNSAFEVNKSISIYL